MRLNDDNTLVQVTSLETAGVEVHFRPAGMTGPSGGEETWARELREELVRCALGWMDHTALFGKDVWCDGYTVGPVAVHLGPNPKEWAYGYRVDLHNVRRDPDDDFEEQWSVIVWPKSYALVDDWQLDLDSVIYSGFAWRRFESFGSPGAEALLRACFGEGGEPPPFIPNR